MQKLLARYSMQDIKTELKTDEQKDDKEEQQ